MREKNMKAPAGKRQLDNLDFLTAAMDKDYSRAKLAWLEVIRDAVACYWFFGLKSSGVTPDEFYDAYYYLFHAVSMDPSTWRCSRHRVDVYVDEQGQKVKVKKTFTEQDLKMQCVDQHFDLSGMGKYCTLPRFLAQVKKVRAQIVMANRKQMLSGLSPDRGTGPGLSVNPQLPLQVENVDMDQFLAEQILVEPTSPVQLAELLYADSAPQSVRKGWMECWRVWRQSYHKRVALKKEVLEGQIPSWETQNDQEVRGCSGSGVPEHSAGYSLPVLRTDEGRAGLQAEDPARHGVGINETASVRGPSGPAAG